MKKLSKSLSPEQLHELPGDYFTAVMALLKLCRAYWRAPGILFGGLGKVMVSIEVVSFRFLNLSDMFLVTKKQSH